MKPSILPEKMRGVSFYCDVLTPIFLLLKVFYVTFQFLSMGRAKFWLGTKPFVPIIFIKARALRDRGSETKKSFLPNNAGG